VIQPIDVLKQYWGYDAFRPLQLDIIQSVLDKTDTLALLPTGGGKSICYQVPALVQEGTCIVISPLIALMKDQVNQLKSRNVPAAAIFSGMSAREMDIVFENACQGAYKLLYMSPERLKTDLAKERMKRMNINLIAIDEAHCISQWGYDFRPAYLEIVSIKSILPNVPFLALTATATPEVAIDIQKQLGFHKSQFFQQSFRRQNVSYSVLYESNKQAKLIDILKRVPGTGIVYVRSRGETKMLAERLHKAGISTSFYHAGLPAEDRNKRQDDWMEGKIRVMVCTNAFGMGIDKPDVRIVVHLAPPESLEAYFQEAGRAGRDGKKAYATLLYAPDDALQLNQFFKKSFPPLEYIKRVYLAIGSYTQQAIGSGRGESFDFDLPLFCQQFQLEQSTTHAALRILEQEGWVAISDASSVPARIYINSSREMIYDYQLRNKAADLVIKAVLRLYPGIQREWIEISEGLIARTIRQPVESVINVLQHATKESILLYQPRKEKPQLSYIQDRVAPEQVEIDMDKFNFRRNNAQKRLQATLLYAEKRVCRSIQLLEYFGEKKSEKCGICDICTGRNEAEFNDEQIEAYKRKIIELLQLEPLPFEEVLQAFAPKRHELVAKILNFLVEEAFIVEKEDGLLYPKQAS
jgi:ATP-dependent DNA helicase RecQ